MNALVAGNGLGLFNMIGKLYHEMFSTKSEPDIEAYFCGSSPENCLD